MEQEIDKLASFKKNDRVTEADIKLLVSKNYDADIYNLIKAIIQKDRKLINEIYTNLVMTINDVSSIMGLVSKSCMELYTTLKLLQSGYSQNDIANIFNIKSGRAYYLIKDAQTFTLSTLEEYVNQIAKLDYQVKKGIIDKSFGFEMFLLSN